MVRSQNSIRFAHGTHARAEEIAQGARYFFLRALQKAVPEVLRELAEDEGLERLYDEASATMIDERKNRPVYAPRFLDDLKGLPGARAELRHVLTAWAERYQLDSSWEWMLDSVLCTLWHWREARLKGEVLERTAWGYYMTTEYKFSLGQAAFLPSFTHRFGERALASLDKEALYAEAHAVFDAVFEDFYSHLVQLQTGDNWQAVPTRHNLKQFEWLALWQFGNWRVSQLTAHYHKSENAIYAGLSKASGDLEAKARQGEPGRPSKT